MSTVVIEPSKQHLIALERANQVRLARAALKRQIGEGELTAAEIVLAPPEEAEGMSVADILMSQRRWGAHRCRKLLSGLHISERKPLGQLTARQRGELVRRLEATPAARRVLAPA